MKAERTAEIERCFSTNAEETWLRIETILGAEGHIYATDSKRMGLCPLPFDLMQIYVERFSDAGEKILSKALHHTNARIVAYALIGLKLAESSLLKELPSSLLERKESLEIEHGFFSYTTSLGKFALAEQNEALGVNQHPKMGDEELKEEIFKFLDEETFRPNTKDWYKFIAEFRYAFTAVFLVMAVLIAGSLYYVAQEYIFKRQQMEILISNGKKTGGSIIKVWKKELKSGYVIGYEAEYKFEVNREPYTGKGKLKLDSQIPIFTEFSEPAITYDPNNPSNNATSFDVETFKESRDISFGLSSFSLSSLEGFLKGIVVLIFGLLCASGRWLLNKIVNAVRG